jgi:hypothetical protein
VGKVEGKAVAGDGAWSEESNLVASASPAWSNSAVFIFSITTVFILRITAVLIHSITIAFINTIPIVFFLNPQHHFCNIV